MSRVHYPTPNNQVYTQLDTPTTLNQPTPRPRQHSETNMGYQSYGGHSDRETPGPIPNPEVKPASADGTAPERWWESRTPPNILSNRGHPRGGLCCVGGPDWLPRHSQHHSDDPEKVTIRGRPATRPASRPWIRQQQRPATAAVLLVLREQPRLRAALRGQARRGQDARSARRPDRLACAAQG
jgi:hypothetical protein